MSKLKQWASSAHAGLWRWAAPPVFADAFKTRTAAAMNTLLLATVGLWSATVILMVLFHTGRSINLLIAACASALLLAVREVLRRGRIAMAATLGTGLAWLVVTSFLYNLHTPYSIHLVGYLVVVIAAAWFGGLRAGAALSLLSAASVFLLARVEAAGQLPPAVRLPPLNLAINTAGYLGVSAVLLVLARTNFMRALREAHAEIAGRQGVEAALRELNATLEQRVAERTQTLRLSEERYRTLLMLSPDGVSVTDTTGHILTCNEQFAHMHGYAHSSEVIGRCAAEFTRPEEYARLFDRVAAAFAAGGSVVSGVEVPVARRDGAEIITEYSITQAPWPGAPSDVAFIANIRDITRRKELAAELEQHRSHLEELVQARTRDLQAEIARRTVAQAALQRSQTSLAEAERIAHVGSWERHLITDDLVYVSEEFYHIFGIAPGTPPEAAVAAAWDAVHPDDAAAVEAAYESALRMGGLEALTFRIILPSGETRVIHGVAEVVLDAAGQPVHVRSTVHDVTERERVMRELDQRVQELSILQELGRTVPFALSLEEIIGTYLERIVTLADIDVARAHLLREGRLDLAGVAPAGAGDPSAAGERLCELAAQTGQTVYVREVEDDPRCAGTDGRAAGLHTLAALPLRSGEAIIGVLAVAARAPDAFAGRLAFLETIAGLVAARLQNALLHQEIRARAAGLEESVAERTVELQTERNRTQAILETVGESVIVTDLDGQTLYLNPATEALTGFSRDESLGQPIWRHWSTQTLKDGWPLAQKALSERRSWRGEVAGYRKDGEIYVVALTGTPLYDERAAPLVTGAVWVLRDITSIKEAERLKDQFVSNVSHELRTPISIIALSCDNLDAFHDRLDEGQRRQLLRDIHKQAHLLGEVVEDILTLSQIDSRRIPQTRGRVDLARLVSEEAARQRPLAQGRFQQLSVKLAATPIILGNEAQLQRVIRNLLDNAIKYTPEGGEVCCTCDIRSGALAALANTPGAPRVPDRTWGVVEIADGGIGIPADAIPFLFERFFRVDTEGEVAGAGLGLPIARELIGLHGGWIDVASTPGQGSTFTVYLPLEGREA